MFTPYTARTLARWCESLSRRVPSVAADPDGPAEIAGMVHDRCLAAARRHGWLGVVSVGALEIGSLLALAVRIGRNRAVGLVPTAHLTASTGAPPPPRGPRLGLALRLGLKRLLAGRANASLAIVTLALGIGLSTAVYSVLDTLVWRPVPYANADRLVELGTYDLERKFIFFGFDKLALVGAWRAQTDLFDAVEGYATQSVVHTDDGGSQMVAGVTVTPGLFTMLGVAPEAGRLFREGDGRTGSSNQVVISHRFWRTELQGDARAVGRALVLDDAEYRVIGIMPASFRFPGSGIDLWMPLDASAPPANTDIRLFSPVARRTAGTTFDAVEHEAKLRGARLSESVGDPPTQTAAVYAMTGALNDRTRQSLWLLAGAVGFLFLVVAANVANLALSRSLQRARDLAVRAALGASRADLVRETLSENGMIAVAGCAGGLVLAVLLIRVAAVSLPDAMTSSAFIPIALNARAALFAAGLGALSAFAFGLPAAILSTGSSVQTILGSTSRASTASRGSRRARAGLVVIEVALCSLLLVGGALMTRSFIRLQTASKGFDATNLISVRVVLPASYRDVAVRDRLMDDIVTRLEHTPGVGTVTAGGLPTTARPLMLGALVFSDRPDAPIPQAIVPMHDVPANYFATLGIPLLRGRVFQRDDTADSVVVSETLARKYWPGQAGVGAQFKAGTLPNWQTVIGVVGDISPLIGFEGPNSGIVLYYQTGKAPAAMQRVTARVAVLDTRILLIRAPDPSAAMAAVRPAVHGVDPRVVISQVAPVERMYAEAIARPRTVFLLMTIFAVAGLVLAMAGMYGVLSYLVTQRVREIGVRLALGARPADVGRIVLGGGIGLAAMGLAAGLALAALVARLLQSIVTDMGPATVSSFAVVAVLLIATAAGASWAPARKAMRVDPVRLLREDGL